MDPSAGSNWETGPHAGSGGDLTLGSWHGTGGNALCYGTSGSDSGEGGDRSAGDPRVFDGIEFVWVPAGQFQRKADCREASPLGAGCPELEPPSGAVEMFLLSGHRDHLDAAAPLPEPFPKLPVAFPPVIELASGSHARVDVDEDGPVRLDSHRQPEGEILDPPPGAANIDPARQQVRFDPELLEAVHLLLLGSQPGHLRMIEHGIKGKQAPPGDFRGSLPAVTQVVDRQ